MKIYCSSGKLEIILGRNEGIVLPGGDILCLLDNTKEPKKAFLIFSPKGGYAASEYENRSALYETDGMLPAQWFLLKEGDVCHTSFIGCEGAWVRVKAASSMMVSVCEIHSDGSVIFSINSSHTGSIQEMRASFFRIATEIGEPGGRCFLRFLPVD